MYQIESAVGRPANEDPHGDSEGSRSRDSQSESAARSERADLHREHGPADRLDAERLLGSSIAVSLDKFL